MKKLLKSLVLFAAAAMALTSCENEAMNEGIETNDTYTLNFVAGAPESKTSVTINGNAANFAWGADEEFVFVQNTEGETAITLGSNVTFTNNGGVANISATFTGSAEAEYNHVAIYPAAAWVDVKSEDLAKSNFNNAKLFIKDNQALVEGNFDPNADLMVSKKVACVASALPQKLQFTRLVSIAEMNLKNLDVADGEKILSVAFSVSESTPALAGRSYVDLSTGVVNEYGYYGKTNTITLSNVDGIASDSESTKVYFTCIPATVASGATYTVTVTTDVAKYTKSANLAKDLIFEVGKVKAFGVNMADAVKEKVGDMSGQYIIVAKDGGNYFYMSTWKDGQASITGGNNRTAVDSGVAEITDFTNSAADFSDADEKYIWTVKAVEGGYTFANSDESAWLYLGSNDNRGKMTTTANNAAIFTIDKNSETNVFTIVDNEHSRTLAYNKASALFACYASGQQPALYLIPVKEDNRTAQTLSFPEESYEITEGDEFKAPTVEGAITTVTYASSKESVATVNAENGEVTIVGTGTTTITATAVATDTYKAGEASYTLKVNSATPDVIEAITIAEFLEKDVDFDTYYELTGKITNIANDTYGNLTIQDATASVYVYGFTATKLVNTSNDRSFASLGLNVGDVVTLHAIRNEYNGGIQAGGTNESSANSYPAYYISHYGITATAASTSIEAEGGNITITVGSVGTLPEAVTATLSEGSEFASLTFADNTATVTFAENEGGARTATVTFTCGLATKKITLAQTSANTGDNTTPCYVKVTTTPTDWSGTYLVVYESSSTVGYVFKSNDLTSKTNYTTNTVISSSQIEATSELANYAVVIEKYSTGYAIKSVGGNNYLQGKGSSSNGTEGLASPSKVTTLTLNSDSTVSIVNNTNHFVFNTQGYMRFYKATTASGSAYKKMTLYKLAE